MRLQSSAFPRRLAIAVVLLGTINAGFWLLGLFFSLARPVVNLDLTVGLLVMSWSRRWGVALLVLGWLADGLVSQSLLFHFQSPAEFLAAARFLKSVELGQLVSPIRILIVLPFIAVLIGLSASTARWRDSRSCVAYLSTALLVIDVLNGSSALLGRDTRFVTFNVVGSPTVSAVVHSLRSRDAGVLTHLEPPQFVTGALDVVTWAERHPGGSIVLVIVESLGYHKADVLRLSLRDQLVNDVVNAKWNLQALTLPFKGSTTYGELRALCGLSGPYLALTAEIGSGCLPARLARLGWSTVGLHGFTGSMFDRHEWWPLTGLQRLEFLESAPRADSRLCGVGFRGLCDDEMIARAFSVAQKPSSFTYVLTLNTHLPLEPEQLASAAEARCRNAGASDDVCLLTERLGKVMTSIARHLERSKVTPLVIVIGDHAPPFANRESRNQFDPGLVPAYILVPR